MQTKRVLKTESAAGELFQFKFVVPSLRRALASDRELIYSRWILC